MRVLIACEFSGIVRDAFIARGHDAISCDLIPSERLGPHIMDDVLLVLEDGWDMCIAFPPCTYLCVSGLHWNTRRPERAELTHDAVLFFMALADADIPRIAIENPVGIMSHEFRKPDQIIQPYQFGHDASKKTCLWLKGLPPLRQTKFIEPRLTCCGQVLADGLGKYGCPNCNGEKTARPRWENQTDSGQNRLAPSEHRAADRARTYSGIANAMADQWRKND